MTSGDPRAERAGNASAAQRLADATGAEITPADGAFTTVDFGSALRRPATEPLLSRAASGPVGGAPEAALGWAPANVSLPEAAEPTAVAANGGPPGGGAGASHAATSPDVDELYEHIVERLRRDLLFERERMGDLLGDLP